MFRQNIQSSQIEQKNGAPRRDAIHFGPNGTLRERQTVLRFFEFKGILRYLRLQVFEGIRRAIFRYSLMYFVFYNRNRQLVSKHTEIRLKPK